MQLQSNFAILSFVAKSTPTLFNRATRNLFIACVALNTISWIVLFWKIPKTDDTIFLHYNIYYGIDLTGAWAELFWMPVSGLAILFLNIVLLYSFKQLDQLIRFIILSTTAVFELMIVLASVLIVLLNR